MREETVQLAHAQRALVVTWAAGFGACLVVMFVLSVAGTFGSGAQEAWAWFLPTLLPTVGLAVGTAMVQRADGPTQVVPRFVATLASVLSCAYILLVFATLLAWPLAGKGPLQWFRSAGYWLGPTQGLVSGALAALFTGQRARAPGGDSAGAGEPSAGPPSGGTK